MSRFKMYPPLVDVMRGEIDKHLMKTTGMSDGKVIGKVIEISKGELLDTLDILVMSSENIWRKRGSHVIFPESLETLLRLAKTEVHGNLIDWPFPYDTFVVSVPDGFKIDGIPVPPFLVSVEDYNGHTALRTLFKELGKPDFNIMSDKKLDGYRISISFQADKVKDTETYHYCHTNVMLSQLDDLSAISGTDFTALGRAITEAGRKDYVGRVELSESDAKLTGFMVRFVVGLAVYHKATNGEFFRDGFPDGKKQQLSGIRSADIKGLKSHTFTIASMDRSATAAHYRSWHFRQLRAERFYRGEHAGEPVGSRWIFVKDTVVGEKVEPHTVEVK